jgi:hypothetical protein
MTTSTFYADSVDDYIYSTDSGGSWANAWDGATYTAIGGSGGGNLAVGQTYDETYHLEDPEWESWWSYDVAIYQSYVSWLTSDVPDGDSVTGVTASLWLTGDFSSQDFTVQAVSKDWGTSVTTADWNDPYDVSYTLLATLASSGIGSTGAYKDFTENSTNFQSAINKTGTTRIALWSSRTKAHNQESNGVYSYLSFATTEEATGTTHDPKLVVVHGSGSVQNSQTIAATITLSGALAKNILKAVNANTTFTRALTNRTQKSLDVNTTLGPSLGFAKQFQMALAAAVRFLTRRSF